MNSKWERVSHSTFETTMRLPVPGGWLYHVETKHCQYGVGEVGQSVSLCFVPIPKEIPKPPG